MKNISKYISTFSVFCVGVLITFFLSEFYNDINDENRTNFSKEESSTITSFIDTSIEGGEREFMFSSIMKTFPNMTLSNYRDIGALPGRPAFILDEEPSGIWDGFIFTRKVLNKDRASFEEKMSLEYNKTIKINDYTTQETVEERDVYWPVFYHIVSAKIIGSDLLTEPGRLSALNHILETGEVSYSPPVLSIKRGTISYLKMLEVLTTPEGDTGVMTIFTNLERVVETKTNVINFLDGGNGGRRITITQIQDGEENPVYERGSAPDLIFDKYLIKNNQTTFNVKIYDDLDFDNKKESLIFIAIGSLVSLSMGIWEFFRSGANRKAEETSLAKSKFLSNISHEIRTPINGIVGISDVLARMNITGELGKYIGIIGSCSSTLLSLLNNVLDMSKIDAGKMENNLSEFSLRTLVLRSIRDAWEVLVAKKSKIERIYVTISNSVPLKIFSNDTHLFQILNNLISNAVKFTDKGYIEVKIDAMQKLDNKINITISVRDTGCGMTEEAVKRLFLAFSRIHNGDNEKDGTGLGLAISLALIKQMGGTITCKSVVGIGTTFTASLILDGTIRNENADMETVIFEENHLIDDEYIGIKNKVKSVNVKLRSDCTILVVDDNKTNQMVLVHMLTSIGATPSNILVANDGAECIHVTTNKKVDIIFMDKFMSNMGGLEATSLIRKDSKNMSHKSPIVFISADIDSETITDCIEAGGNDFIAKPYRMDDIIDILYKIDKNFVQLFYPTPLTLKNGNV